MKNIYDFLNESRGMDVFARDEYRSQDHTDPLIRNHNNRANRLESFKYEKIQEKISNLLSSEGIDLCTFKINNYITYTENIVLDSWAQYEDVPASIIFNPHDEAPNDVILSFIHLKENKDFYKTVKDDAKYNLINNYFAHDRRLNKFVIDVVNDDENLKPGLRIYAKNKTLCLIIITSVTGDDDEKAEAVKFFNQNWNDITYAVKKFYQLYSKIYDYNDSL